MCHTACDTKTSVLTMTFERNRGPSMPAGCITRGPRCVPHHDLSCLAEQIISNNKSRSIYLPYRLTGSLIQINFVTKHFRQQRANDALNVFSLCVSSCGLTVVRRNLTLLELAGYCIVFLSKNQSYHQIQLELVTKGDQYPHTTP